MRNRNDDIVQGAKITVIVTSALLLCCGLFIIFWSEGNLEVVRVLVGVISILMGGSRLFGYFSNDLYRLAFQAGYAEGAFCVILGILFLLSPSGVFSVFPYIVGIYVILDGMLKLQTAMDARTFGMHNWVILIISACVTGVLGILTVVLETYAVNTAMLVGIALAADGAENMWETMYTVRVRTKKLVTPVELPEAVTKIAEDRDQKESL